MTQDATVSSTVPKEMNTSFICNAVLTMCLSDKRLADAAALTAAKPEFNKVVNPCICDL